MTTTVHLINHTHWDREWFLTSIYTRQWIPGLIDKIRQLVTDNPDYHYLLDGQTLIIEDLLEIEPGYGATVRELVNSQNLIIGPYYCQPDWQLSDGESLIRNLLYGRQDMDRYGGDNRAGWLVDTFGHISQGPQLHRLFGLESVFVWRGVPQLEPYFHWQGADGQTILAINLFGGYRNLYGVTHVPAIALKRLQAEINKLQPFYPTADIPMFDGYDLEQEPEDPLRFYQQHAPPLPEDIRLKESTPQKFGREISRQLPELPVIAGELNSGKYGATFPGTLSTRTYLKIMNRDCEVLLYRLCEPLATMARLKGRPYNAQQYETWGRTLLQNMVHDCICGVSIDLVHQKMEFNYQKLFQAARQDIRESLAYILSDFSPGLYAVSANPFACESWMLVEGKLYHVQTDGLGVWPVSHPQPVGAPNTPLALFEWQNDHYAALVRSDGVVEIGQARLGYLLVTSDQGDTYSIEPGDQRRLCRPTGPLILEHNSNDYAVVRYQCQLDEGQTSIKAMVRLIFDPTPLLRWQVELDSRGTGFKVEMVFETAQPGQVYAGMSFDVVQRPVADRDLLPRQLDEPLAKVLLGQRELEAVTTFPFHDFVTISNGDSSAVVLAKGLRAYRTEENGAIYLTLRRAVEWLTRSNLKHRAGDAGPFMYVPDARCERAVQHELAVMFSQTAPNDLTIHRWNAAFQNPPLIVAAKGQGRQTTWPFLQENLPLSSLHIYNHKLLARFFNPTATKQPLAQEYLKTDVWGRPEAVIQEARPKEIVTVQIEATLLGAGVVPAPPAVTPVVWPVWRVGQNQGQPDPQIIQQHQTQITQLQIQLAHIEQQLKNLKEEAQYTLQHKYYVLKRELYELQLSALLNNSKFAEPDGLSEEYLYTIDEEIARLGLALNNLRIRRRIYDYVVEAL